MRMSAKIRSALSTLTAITSIPLVSWAQSAVPNTEKQPHFSNYQGPSLRLAAALMELSYEHRSQAMSAGGYGVPERVLHFVARDVTWGPVVSVSPSYSSHQGLRIAIDGSFFFGFKSRQPSGTIPYTTLEYYSQWTIGPSVGYRPNFWPICEVDLSVGFVSSSFGVSQNEVGAYNNVYTSRDYTGVHWRSSLFSRPWGLGTSLAMVFSVEGTSQKASKSSVNTLGGSLGVSVGYLAFPCVSCAPINKALLFVFVSSPKACVDVRVIAGPPLFHLVNTYLQK